MHLPNQRLHFAAVTRIGQFRQCQRNWPNILAVKINLRWSVNAALTPTKAKQLADELGAQLYQTLFGAEGAQVLESITPTALLFDVDETILLDADIDEGTEVYDVADGSLQEHAGF